MAKNQTVGNPVKKAPMTSEDAQNMVQAIIDNGGIVPDAYSHWTEAQMWEVLESTENSGFESLNAGYLQMSEGQVLNLIYQGVEISNLKNKQTGEPVMVAKFENKAGEKFIFGGVTVVGSLKNIQPPCFVRLVHKGKEKTSNGEYHDIEVLTFAAKKIVTENATAEVVGGDGLGF